MTRTTTRRFTGFTFPLTLLATATLVAATSCVVKSGDSDDDAGEGGGSGESNLGGGGAMAGSGASGSPGGGSSSGGMGGTLSGGGSSATAGMTAAGAGGKSDAGAPGGGMNASGSAGAPPSDNCPDAADPDQTDTDHDGKGDVCDPDDDDDGFSDENDPEPKNAAVPGDYSTPEKVLANPKIQEALAALHDAGFDLPTHTETTPPDVSGYHHKADGDGEFVANSGGGGVGQGIVGYEERVDLNDDGTLDTFNVSFDGTDPTSYTVQRGQLLRGTGDEFTIYSTSRTVCTESGANFARYSVSIESGTLDAATGDWKDDLSLGVTVATSGTLTSACANRFNGEGENVGAWTAASTELISQIQPADLEYLCVDGDAGYAPTETWTGAGGKACECTTAYAVSCQE